MRKAVLLSTLLLAGVVPVGAAYAQPAARAATAAVSDREKLDFLVGRWAAAATDPGTGKTERLDYRVERAPGGAWLAGAGSAPDGSFNARDVWGQDPLTGEVIRMAFDGGGAIATMRSPGWVGDTLVLEGEARTKGGVQRLRQTITRLGPDRFRAVWEAYRDGAWSPYSVELLTREA